MLDNPWSAVGTPPLFSAPSGSSFGPSGLAPGIHHLLLSNLTTGLEACCLVEYGPFTCIIRISSVLKNNNNNNNNHRFTAVIQVNLR